MCHRSSSGTFRIRPARRFGWSPAASGYLLPESGPNLHAPFAHSVYCRGRRGTDSRPFSRSTKNRLRRRDSFPIARIRACFQCKKFGIFLQQRKVVVHQNLRTVPPAVLLDGRSEPAERRILHPCTARQTGQKIERLRPKVSGLFFIGAQQEPVGLRIVRFGEGQGFFQQIVFFFYVQIWFSFSV